MINLNSIKDGGKSLNKQRIYSAGGTSIRTKPFPAAEPISTLKLLGINLHQQVEVT